MSIRNDVVHGSVVWLQRGDKSKPALVFVHGGLGTAVGASFLPHLPKDTPVVALQAPELLEYQPTRSLTERAILYRDILFSAWGGCNLSVHVVGFSFGGPLAFELALLVFIHSLRRTSDHI